FRPAFLSIDWTGLDEDEDAHVWEDNWDDDNVEDDFSNQLSFRNPLLTHNYNLNCFKHSEQSQIL
uniref:26S proteasome complex subunit SEM1 n=1 Tax=Zosterops lateralis melanops TaxID=1220523 RepID=A0A8D2PRV7_ZOSLA